VRIARVVDVATLGSPGFQKCGLAWLMDVLRGEVFEWTCKDRCDGLVVGTWPGQRSLVPDLRFND